MDVDQSDSNLMQAKQVDKHSNQGLCEELKGFFIALLITVRNNGSNLSIVGGGWSGGTGVQIYF